MMQARPLTDREAHWARLAARAPVISVLRWALRLVLVALTIPGILYLHLLVRWGVNAGHGRMLFLIGLHVGALILAMGIPSARPSRTARPGRFLAAIRERYGARADRLLALGWAVTIETVVLFLIPPIATAVAGHKLQWPVEFVIAVVVCSVVWPLERIARAARAEAHRISDEPG